MPPAQPPAPANQPPPQGPQPGRYQGSPPHQPSTAGPHHDPSASQGPVAPWSFSAPPAPHQPAPPQPSVPPQPFSQPFPYGPPQPEAGPAKPSRKDRRRERKEAKAIRKAASTEVATGDLADSDDTYPPPPQKSKTKRRLWLAAAVLLVVIALIGGGTTLGYYAQNEWASRQSLPAPTIITAPVPAYQEGAEVLMPDVRGLDEAAARQLLIDAGIPADKVSTTAEPAAGVPGSVFDQSPASGTANPAGVLLVLAAEARMPDIANKNGQQLSVELQKLGAQVEIQQRYQAGAAAGTVIQSTPAPGQALPDDVVLVVAEPGSSIYLSNLDAVGSSCSTGEASLNGQDFQNSLACSAGSRQANVYEWVTKRAADQLTATVGIADEDDADGRARIDVFADGRLVASVVASYGTTVPLNAPISGALRISVAVTEIGGEDTPQPVLGDARLVGSSDAMARIRDS